MDDIDRRLIQLHIETLSKETDFNLLWKELLLRKKNIITRHLEQKYKNLEEGEIKNFKLYSDILTRGKEAFSVLVDALRVHQPHLAELLSPTERTLTPPHHEENAEELLNEDSDCVGFCYIQGDKGDKDIKASVKVLCHTIRAKLISSKHDVTEVASVEFLLLIYVNSSNLNVTNTKEFYKIPGNRKLIIINILSAEEREHNYQRDSFFDEVFIINIHTHSGDHVPSVIKVIQKVIAHNRYYDVRDIFHVVMEKIAKWNCRLSTESQNFPKFYFSP